MKKGFSIIIVSFLILFISCDKVITEFRIDGINMDAYPRITDTVILRELIYNNPTISGIDDYLFFTKKYDDQSDEEYEARRRYQIRRFDDFFWERVNRDSLEKAKKAEGMREIKDLFFTRDSMTYRIIDTLYLKSHTGILVYSNSEFRVLKKLYLSIYNQEKELEETFIVAVKYDQPIDWREKYSLIINTYSTLSSRNRLNTYITEENMEHEIGKKTEIHSIYDLNKLKMIKSDTVTTGEYPIMDASGVLWR